jgi:S-adenosylmethionine hydrolase
LSDIGFATDSLVKKTFLKPNLVKDVLEVHVIYVDGYGNCNLDITYDEFEKLCNKRDFEVQVREVTVKKLYRSYVDGERQARPRSSLILTVSSLGNLQLAINNGNAAQYFNLEYMSSVQIKFL